MGDFIGQSKRGEELTDDVSYILWSKEERFFYMVFYVMGRWQEGESGS